MRKRLILGALALASAALPAMASADDPNDPSMRTAAARARDRAIIRQLNQQQLAYVRQRDAQYAEGWHAYRNRGADSADYESASRRYSQERRNHERQMAAWRRAVAACRNGDYSACDN